MSLKSNPSSMSDLSLNNFMTLAHSLSIEGLDTNFSLNGCHETEDVNVNEIKKSETVDNSISELRQAIEVLKKSLLEFEIELVFSNDIELDELNLKIQKYYYNKILYENLEKEYREKKSKLKANLF